MRIWGITAFFIALLFMLRGAFVLALALFLLSPAPVLLFSHSASDQSRLSLSWLGVLLGLIVALGALFGLVVFLGGIPQVHEWSAILRGSGR